MEKDNIIPLNPIGTGVFGNIYDQFKGKAKEAFEFLIANEEGDLLLKLATLPSKMSIKQFFKQVIR